MKLPSVGLLAPESTTELTRLRAQLEDLRAAFSAIRNGGVDGIMGGDPNDQKLYTLTSADRPYRVIVEDMGEGAATVSERGVLLYVNRRLASLIEREPRDLVGSDVAALVGDNDRAALDEQLSVTAGHTRRAELSLLRRDGSRFLAMTSATGLDIDGVLVRCLVVSDLTERRRVEQQIADANARIAAHAAELERANTELARSNEDLAQFAYAASHDLAEPLRSISGFADLFRLRYRGQLDADADDYIDFITSGAVRMQQLINDLLSYSRVSTRAQPLEPVDLEEVMTDVLADLNTRLAETRAIVRVDPLPVVNADRTQFTKVFANLIRNAVTFVAPGTTPAVHVFAERDDMGWRFTVADNGIGIPTAHRQRVFGMFKRLHSRDAYPGTGVGLAIVQKVVQRHSSEIWIQDNPGGGSRFTFTIPDTPSTPGDDPDTRPQAATMHDPDRWTLR
jgi:hypothetical protein